MILSLVAGVYGKLDVLYAGIVAEKACNENKNRFLIFFDDGFAQYLSVKKLHHVYNTGKKVWDDVAEHSREFIQEYLEEFPSRPMVKVKAGQWVKTEWRGQWLKAKVMQLDCSLIKMLFQIDNRSEWIYRGSTRLEPLYSAIDGKISTAKKSKRSRKMNRTSLSKSNEPFIDYGITKPCFGVCLYSKTDPKGEQQRQMEAKRQQTLNQQQEERNAAPSPSTSSSAANTPSSSSASWTGGPTGGRGSDGLTRDAPGQRSEPQQGTAARGSSGQAGSGGTGRTSGPVATEAGARAFTTQPGSQAPAPRGYSGMKHAQKATNDGGSAQPGRELSASSLAPRTLAAKSYEQVQAAPMRGALFQAPVEGGSVSPFEEGPGNRGGGLAQAVSSAQYTPDSSAAIKASHMRKRTSAGFVSVQSGGIEVIDLEADVQVTDEPLLRKEGLYEHRALPEDFHNSWEAPWLRKNRRDIRSTGTNRAPAVRLPSNNKRKQDMASLIEARLRNGDSTRLDEEPELPLFLTKSIRKGPHKCGPGCVQAEPAIQQVLTRHNTLAVPMLHRWRREVVMKNPGNRKEVYYRAPCNRRLRSIAEVARYLTITGSTNVTIDQFCFDARVSCHDAPDRGSKEIIPDISYGKEPVPIPVMNLLDSSYPPPVDYITHRIWKEGLDVVLDPGFLACCDCTDDCQDKTKCSCAQLTVSASATIDGKEDLNCGYEYRRLKDCVTTGIYECNQNCSCSSRCFNRVVQNGLRCRLQTFKTVNRGWGLRTVDDIPAGTFVCTYTGLILNEEMANKEGKDFGDEYFAELDHIEIVEKAKEGYESNVSELEEDDSVILDRLGGLSSASDSGCDRSCSSDSDTSDAESLISVGSSLSNRSGSRAGDVTSLARTHRRRKRKKSTRKSSKKMKGILGQESLVVERESKVHSLSHIADEKWCLLALKRNHDDPKAAAAFLKNIMKSRASGQTSEDVTDSLGEEWAQQWNSGLTSVLDQRMRDITDEENTTQSSDFDFDDIGAEAVENHLKLRGAVSATAEGTAATPGADPEVKDVHSADLLKDESKSCLEKGDQEEHAPSLLNPEIQDKAADSPDSAPSLLSAVDLSRLAAQNPKLDEGPPVLVKMNPRRQANTLEDMITRLKNRVLVEINTSKERNQEQGNSVDKEPAVPDSLPSSGQICSPADDEGHSTHAHSDAPLTGGTESSRTRVFENMRCGIATEPLEQSASGDDKPARELPGDCVVGEPALDEMNSGNSNVGGLGERHRVEGKPGSDPSAVGSTEGKFDEKAPSVRMELVSDFSSSEVADLDVSFPPSPASCRSDLSRSESIDRKSEVSTDDSRSRIHRGKPAGGESKGHKVKIRPATKPVMASPHTPERSLSRQSSVSSRRVSTRTYFGDEPCYVIDAKQYGNCGRYLNHSCSPNLFVQNVFVDTHDLRFPWVAFFAQHNIPSGSELTWDYMYEVGSVQDKVLHCYCGSAECRGRLL